MVRLQFKRSLADVSLVVQLLRLTSKATLLVDAALVLVDAALVPVAAVDSVAVVDSAVESVVPPDFVAWPCSVERSDWPLEFAATHQVLTSNRTFANQRMTERLANLTERLA